MERSTPPLPDHPHGLARRLALLCVPLAFVLAACGGSSGSTGSTTSDDGDPAGADAADLDVYRACLAEHGVELPARPATGEGRQADGPPAGGQALGGGSEDFAAAQGACADLAPAGGFPGAGPGGGFGGSAITEYTDCLAEHGVEVEVPGPGSGQGPPADQAPDGASGMFGLDDTDPAVAAALDACGDLAPDLPAAGGGR